MNVKIKKTNQVELFVCGESIGEFKPESEWCGMTRYINNTGHVIVKNRGELECIFSDILGNIFDSSKESRVVSASSNIADKIHNLSK